MIEIPVVAAIVLLFAAFFPGLNFDFSGGEWGFWRRSSTEVNGTRLQMGGICLRYEAGPYVVTDNGMYCGEFRTGTGSAWRNGLAYAGTSSRWFVGWHR